ncbi:hypothetical protein AYR54_10145 [Loigolactobacillus backii]|uniref:DUF4811 domain-containing protein n=1 Tax=Loigolactobacillus backii TaxID=375175 RepID=UPI0007F126F9|nr:DUF4811 domain-containing protein [Loigolactobacillus backii]ANK60615.1 hypothetical protein AYR52_10340 [Loigolactobacillus backii]ANK65568.1 hypothetical protein AYR54_10145 [Loigolactobacillus backii]ANK68039.1 hypothetical protein AYR55_10265 [Loigolactobacillus backii]OLF67774.1 hypothetical protein ACX53_12485 [Loigolactobacillus backii]PIO86742.1 hypothetical protein B8A32_06080 [Loigolactobacillus backii]
MIIVLIIVGAILFAVFTIGLKSGWLRNVLIVLALAILIWPITSISATDNNHYGMKEKTTTTEKSIASAADMKGANINMLLYQPLGNGKEKVYIYKTDKTQKKPTTTQADEKTTNKVVKSGSTKTAKLVTKTTHYVFKNNFFKAMYAGLDADNQYKERTNTFKVGNNWLVLSTKQAKQLQKQATAAQKQMKTAIETQVKEAMTKDPSMSKSQQKALTQQLEQKAQQQAQQQMMQKLQQMQK